MRSEANGTRGPGLIVALDSGSHINAGHQPPAVAHMRLSWNRLSYPHTTSLLGVPKSFGKAVQRGRLRTFHVDPAVLPSLFRGANELGDWAGTESLVPEYRNDISVRPVKRDDAEGKDLVGLTLPRTEYRVFPPVTTGWGGAVLRACS